MSKNNGGETDYYKLPVPRDETGNLQDYVMAQDLIEHRDMNYAQGNIAKVAWTFNTSRHSGTDYERDLNKLIFFANRELKRIKQIN